MEMQDQQNAHSNRRDQYANYYSRGGKIMSGLIVVLIGAVLLARKMGVDIPYWVTSWEMLVIAIGFFIGAKHSFRGYGWMFPVLIGSAFLVGHIVPELDIRNYMWPVIIITIGLVMMFNPRRSHRYKRRHWKRPELSMDDRGNSEDFIDAVSVFGGMEKNIVTKDFKGGDIVTFFGGTSLNLSQSDIKEKATLDLTQVFGGTQLIIPSNWRLQSEMVSVFGSVEDKRSLLKDHSTDTVKTLVLRGTSVFGGIEIRSY